MVLHKVNSIKMLSFMRVYFFFRDVFTLLFKFPAGVIINNNTYIISFL